MIKRQESNRMTSYSLSVTSGTRPRILAFMTSISSARLFEYNIAKRKDENCKKGIIHAFLTSRLFQIASKQAFKQNEDNRKEIENNAYRWNYSGSHCFDCCDCCNRTLHQK